MLLSDARAEGTLVHDITSLKIPNQRAPSRDGHLFVHNAQPLIDAVSSWLAERQL